MIGKHACSANCPCPNGCHTAMVERVASRVASLPIVFQRLSDKKLFKTGYLAHWTDVTADDGEEAEVKHRTGKSYVSRDGDDFLLLKSPY